MTWRAASLGAWTRSVGIAVGSAVCLAAPAFAQLVRVLPTQNGPKVLIVPFGRVQPADSTIAIEVSDAFRDRIQAAHADDFTAIQKRVMCDALDQSGFGCTVELEPTQVGQLAGVLNARFIVDNWHNEAAAPLRETMKAARFVSLINFPGPDGTVSLFDVLSDNRTRLKTAAGY